MHSKKEQQHSAKATFLTPQMIQKTVLLVICHIFIFNYKAEMNCNYLKPLLISTLSCENKLQYRMLIKPVFDNTVANGFNRWRQYKGKINIEKHVSHYVTRD